MYVSIYNQSCTYHVSKTHAIFMGQFEAASRASIVEESDEVAVSGDPCRRHGNDMIGTKHTDNICICYAHVDMSIVALGLPSFEHQVIVKDSGSK